MMSRSRNTLGFGKYLLLKNRFRDLRRIGIEEQTKRSKGKSFDKHFWSGPARLWADFDLAGASFRVILRKRKAERVKRKRQILRQ